MKPAPSRAILLNFASERILAYSEDANSDSGRGDTSEDLPFRVDLRYKRAFDVYENEFELAFTARNVLGEEYEQTRETTGGDVTFDSWDLGRTFSVSLTGRF